MGHFAECLHCKWWNFSTYFPGIGSMTWGGCAKGLSGGSEETAARQRLCQLAAVRTKLLAALLAKPGSLFGSFAEYRSSFPAFPHAIFGPSTAARKIVK